jgi:hypothetical protein
VRDLSRVALVLSVAALMAACSPVSYHVSTAASPVSAVTSSAAGSVSSSSSAVTTPPAGTAPAAPEKAPAPSRRLHHPPFGSAERKAILDGLRPVIEKDLGQKVIFEVNELSVADGFVFAAVVPRTQSGGKIDYLKTRYANEMREGVLDGGRDAPLYALLRYRNAAWHVVTFVIGPTDVAYAGWWKQYGAPKAIFPYTE